MKSRLERAIERAVAQLHAAAECGDEAGLDEEEISEVHECAADLSEAWTEVRDREPTGERLAWFAGWKAAKEHADAVQLAIASGALTGDVYSWFHPDHPPNPYPEIDKIP